MANGRNFLLGMMGELQKERERRRKVQEAILSAQIKAQYDPSAMLNTLLMSKMLGIDLGTKPSPITPSFPPSTTEKVPLLEQRYAPPTLREFPATQMGITGISGGQIKIGQTPYSKAMQELYMTGRKERAKAKAKIETGQRAAMSNLNLVTGAFREMAQTYSDAVKEGGMGNVFAEKLSDKALQIGGRWGDYFPATAAWPGQKTEIVTRIMPMLTQQGEKPGSVRLVTTVFERLELTIPSKRTGPKSAKRMIEQSIRNMYRFARAAMQLGLTNEMIEATPDEQLSSISTMMADMAAKIEIAGAEKAMLDRLINNVLAPIDRMIMERQTGITKGTMGPLNLKNNLSQKYSIPLE